MTQGEVFEGGYRNGRLLRHFLVDVTGAGAANLLRALEIAFADLVDADERPSFVAATHVLAEERQLTFFQARGELRRSLLSGSRFDQEPLFAAIAALPTPAGPAEAAQLAQRWLAQADYGADEGDGASYRGWRVFNQRHGSVEGHPAAFIAVRPSWIYLPK